MNIKIENIKMLLTDGKSLKISEGSIYIGDGKILSVDKEPEGITFEKTICGKNRLAIPGLINTHNHAYMTVFRNVADDLSFTDWLFKRISPMEDKLIHEDIYWGTALGCIEMISTGTTCFVDMNLDMEPVVRAVDDMGIRAVLSRGLVGEGYNEGGRVRLEENLNAFKSCKNDKISFMLGPHAPYSCDPEYLKIVTQAARDNNLGLTIHLSEGLTEIHDIQEKYHMSPIELMDSIGLFSVPVLAAHCVQLSDRDISILAKNNVSVASNPKSNLKLANGIAPIHKMHAQGVNVTIGTDGPASNNTLNMFSEMNYMALLHKGTSHDPTAINAVDTLCFATTNAAKAIGNSNIGAIAEGMNADLSILNIDAPQFYPRNNLIAALCYSASGHEVETVIVNGDILMENKEFKTIDTERVYFECEKIIERIDR